jgi:hypothetical protein
VLYRLRNSAQTDRRTDGQTDGRHNDFSRAHFFKNVLYKLIFPANGMIFFALLVSYLLI